MVSTTSHLEASTQGRPVADLFGGRPLADVIAAALAGLDAPQVDVEAIRSGVQTRCRMTLASLVESAGYRLERGEVVVAARPVPRPWDRLATTVSKSFDAGAVARAALAERQAQAREVARAQEVHDRYGDVDERPIIDVRALERPASLADLVARTHLPDGVAFDVDLDSLEQWATSRGTVSTYRVDTDDEAAAQVAIDQAEADAARARLLPAMLGAISGGRYDARWAMGGPASFDRHQRVAVGWASLAHGADNLDTEALQQCSAVIAKDRDIHERYWTGTKEDHVVRKALVMHARTLARRAGMSELL